MASPPSASKMHASPSKGASSSAAALTSANRTYDAKLVQREMLRLGTLAGQLPAAALNTIAGTAAAAVNSASTLVLPTAGVITSGAAGSAHGHSHALGHALAHVHGAAAANGTDGGAWTQLHVYVLPLFNHEQLQYPIEDLNALVRRHIEVVMAAGPSRALATLEVDVGELIAAGMTTLNTKLAGVEDDKLPARVVELWTFFWDQVLPYVEGVFIPLQTSPLLLALHRTPKPHRPTSPTNLTSPDDASSSTASLSPIDVRTIALRAFRDKIIVPVAPRLEARLVAMRPGGSFSSATSVPGMATVAEASAYQHPRLQQMLLVLHSQAQRARPPLSLTAPPPSLSPQELAIRRLLDMLQANRRPLSGSGPSVNGNGTSPLAAPRHRRAPSFLSGGAPRDRRGRVGIGLNSGADSDKENAKRRGRYIDDSVYPPSQIIPSGSMATTASSAHTIGLGEVRGLHRRYAQNQNGWEDEAGEWESRRGRTDPNVSLESGSWDGDTGGGTTPRGRFSAERERERSFLESLRSPGLESEDTGRAQFLQPPSREVNGSRSSSRIGRRDDSLPAPPPKDDVFTASPPQMINGRTSSVEPLDWDSAQAVVERMVGMNSTSSELDTPRIGAPTTQTHPHSQTTSPAPGPPPGQSSGPPSPNPRRRRMT